MPARAPKPRCGSCGHAEHRKGCRALGRSRCVTAGTRDGTMMMCGSRPPCPCTWRECRCGTPVALAAELPPGTRVLPAGGEVMIASVERGSAGDPAGRLAVRKLEDGSLAYRDLPAGEEPGPGEWRGREHANQACSQLAEAEADPKWLTMRGRPGK